MGLIRCSNGHLYPSDRPSCPVCAQGAPVGPTIGVGQVGAGGGATPPGQGLGLGPQDSGVTRPWRPGPDGQPFDPVVGWLVAFEGRMRGKDFRLRGGRKMRIGRHHSMDVQIDDESISREDHAFIHYDDENHTFHLVAGNKGHVRLARKDGRPELVLTPQELNAYDAIHLGQTKLLFVPFCGKTTYQWRDVGGGPTSTGGSWTPE